MLLILTTQVNNSQISYIGNVLPTAQLECKGYQELHILGREGLISLETNLQGLTNSKGET